MDHTIRGHDSISTRLTLMVAGILVMAVLVSGSLDLFERQQQWKHALETKATSLVQFMAQVTPLSILSLNFVEMNNDVKKVVLTDEDAVYALIINEQNIPLVYFFKDTDPLVTEQVRQIVETRKPLVAIDSLKQTGRVLEVTAPIFSGERRIGWAILGLSLDPLRRSLLSQVAMLGIFLVVIIGLSIVLLRLVLRQILHPVETLTAAAMQISTGDLNVPLAGTERTDELGILANAFKSMTDQLRGSILRLEQHVADLKRTSQALRESEERFRAAFENANVGVCLIATDGHVLKVNDAMCQMFGYSQQELEQMHINTISYPDDLALSSTFIKNAIARESDQANFDKRYIHKQGHVVWGHVSISLVRDAQGEPLYFICHVQDTTAQKQAEQALREKTEELDRYFNSALDLLCIADTDGYFRRLNPAWTSTLGYPISELEGQHFLDLVHPDDVEATLQALSRLYNQEEVLNFTNRYRCKSGTYRWIEWRSFPSGKSIYAVARDITEQKRAEAALRESEERFRRLAENAPDAIYRMSLPDGRYEYVSPAVSSIFGYSPEECYARPILIRQALHPDWREYFERQWANLLKGEMPPFYEYQIIHKSGQIRWLNQRNIFVLNEAGLPIAIEGIVTDITERKQAEEALRESDARYRMAQAIGHVGNWEYNLQTTQFWGSDEAKRIYGFDPEQPNFSTEEVENCILERERVHQALIDLIEMGKPYNLEFEIRPKNGVEPRIITSIAELQQDEHGNPRMVVGVIQDITKRKQAEDALVESEKKFRSFVESSSEGFTLVDEQGAIIEWNPAREKMTGLPASQVVGQKLWDVQYQMVLPNLQTPEFYERFKQAILNALQTGQSPLFDRVTEAEVMHPHGPSQFIQQTIFPIKTDKGYRIGSVTSDITERKRIEQALRESEWRYREIFDNVLDGLYLLEVMENGRFRTIEVNPALERITGIPRALSVGKTQEETVPAEIAAVVNAKYRHCVEAGQPIEEEVVLELPAGRRYFHSTLIPACDEVGKIHRIIGISRDITEQKRAEQERQSHLRFFKYMDQVNQAIQGTNDLDQMMNDVLGTVLSIFECDRASLVYPCDPQTPTWRVPMERTRPEYPGAMSSRAEIPSDAGSYDVFSTLLDTDDPVQFGPKVARSLPEVVQRFGTQSQMAIAIHPKSGKPWMFVLHQCSSPRVWTLEEEQIFREIGRRLADALSSLLAYRNLRESEERYRMVFENSPVSIWEEDFSGVKAFFDDLKKEGVVDLEACFAQYPETVQKCAALMKIVDVNQAALTLHEATDKNQLLAGLANTFAPESLDTFRYELVCLWNGETKITQDAVVRTLAGEPRNVTVYVSTCPGYEQSLSKVLVSLANITERKQAEEALAHERALLRTVIDLSPDAIFVKDMEGRKTLTNPADLERTGVHSEAEALGKTDFELYSQDVAARFYANDQVVLQTGQSLLNREEMVVAPDGQLHCLLTSKVPLRNNAGQIIGLVGVGRDITERKHAEQEIKNLNQELEQRVADRTAQLEAANKELEAFAYSVSHDLRAPLRHINGFLEILREHIAATIDEQSQHYMTNISDAAHRMSMLIDDLLSFSRMGRQELSRRQVSLDELVAEIIQEFKPETEGRDVIWQVGPLPDVRGDRAMLRIVLVNLISNALKYTRPRPQAEIEIGCLLGQEKETVVFVRDNGVGFDMKYADKLFGVFQRLHRADEFEGTGIGLANVRRIINRHGGKTWAEGEVGQGTTFYFSLPQSPKGDIK